jgi:aspartate/methionine/tyrosine aminotransferase
MTALRKIILYSTNGVTTFVQHAMIHALRTPESEITAYREEYRKRRDLLVGALNEVGLKCDPPAGAFYAFPNVKRTGWKAKPLAAALLEDAGVALIGGPDFGVLGEGYVRVSYANSTENIVRALDRIGEFLASRKAA